MTTTLIHNGKNWELLIEGENAPYQVTIPITDQQAADLQNIGCEVFES